LRVYKSVLERDLKKIITLRTNLIPRLKKLREAEIIIMSKKKLIEDNDLKAKKDKLYNLSLLLRYNTVYFIKQIRKIYVIQETNKQLTISNIQLPNSDFIGYDEEEISMGLGHVCHIVFLVSKILDIPLKYPLFPRCSRSLVSDERSNKDVQIYPLYSKNSDKKRFEYAVFLLNCNIDQLNVTVEVPFSHYKKRNILSNVNNLLKYLSKGLHCEIENE